MATVNIVVCMDNSCNNQQVCSVHCNNSSEYIRTYLATSHAVGFAMSVRFCQTKVKHLHFEVFLHRCVLQDHQSDINVRGYILWFKNSSTW